MSAPGGPEGDFRSAAPAGLFMSLRRLLATTLELGQVRLQLLGTEIEEQKQRVVSGLIWAIVGALLVGLGLALLIGCVVLLFWEGYRLPAMAVLTLVFLVGGGFALNRSRAQFQTPDGAFAASVAELARDRAALAPDADGDPRQP